MIGVSCGEKEGDFPSFFCVLQHVLHFFLPNNLHISKIVCTFAPEIGKGHAENLLR